MVIKLNVWSIHLIIHLTCHVITIGNLTEIPTCEKPKKKKIEKTHAKEKQSHAQDNIYVIRQFAYVHRVTGISLLSGKSTKNVATIFFTTAKKHGNNRIKP